MTTEMANPQSFDIIQGEVVAFENESVTLRHTNDEIKKYKTKHPMMHLTIGDYATFETDFLGVIKYGVKL